VAVARRAAVPVAQSSHIDPRSWWRDAVIYQIYPRSFADTDGDGVGDLPGIISKLGYLKWLGVDAIWMTPLYPSPDHDFGYDVSDYCAINPRFGTMADFDRLVDKAHGLGIRVVMDLVPNHTSVGHAWFRDARSSRTAAHRDWYVWADPAPGGGPPNNWVDHTGQSAWEWDPGTRQYYLHNFMRTQPDLNWWNPDVRAEFDRIQRFWYDRGVDGFRIDAAQTIIKDRLLRDNPPVDATSPAEDRARGQKYVYNLGRPEVHEVLRRFRAVAEEYDPPRMLFGETSIYTLPELASYYGRDDEVHIGLNMPYMQSRFRAGDLQRVVDGTRQALPPNAWPSWTLSNTEVPRFPTRWTGGDAALSRAALLMHLSLRGTPFLYNGDEIAMPDVPVPLALQRDEMAAPPVRDSRDSQRTPMQWRNAPGGGFTWSPMPWLPLGDVASNNVQDQQADRTSVINLTRDLIQLRHSSEDLRRGAQSTLPSPKDTWVFRRGRTTLVAINLGRADALIRVRGTIALSTGRDRDGEVVKRRLRLRPSEGVILTS
jgi:alpha-glucosidase